MAIVHLLCLSKQLSRVEKERCCQLLLEAGASVTAMNVNGNTLLDIADSDGDVIFMSGAINLEEQLLQMIMCKLTLF
jgi:ankyrin repeat protein